MQLLIYPVTNFADTDYASEKIYANAIPLSTPARLYFAKYYLPNPAEATNPDASPILANLVGLAPATIVEIYGLSRQSSCIGFVG